MSKLDRERAQDMLQVVANDVRKHYYDPKFHGVDWDAKVLEEKQKIDKETSLGMAFSHIAAALDSLNDSHTFFVPPQNRYRHDYGWQFQVIGDRCYITQVRPLSDAEGKGLRPGDEVMAINGFTLSRDNLWKVEYVFGTLRPQSGLRVSLRDRAGVQREIDVMAKFRERKRVTDLTGLSAGGGGDIWDLIRDTESEEHLMRARYVEVGDKLMILKLPEFIFSESEVEGIIGKARECKALIVDLRGNQGGSVETLKYLLGGMFENDVKIGDRVGRATSKPLVTKRHRHSFAGKLVVLVDSRSASASELFARTVQIEKRGVVLGDHTSGSVMEGAHYNYKIGSDTVVFYGASITDADVVMTDGKSLEHTGVTPDETILPTAADLASGRDPVMARAAERLENKLSPDEAGKLFPYEWPKD